MNLFFPIFIDSNKEEEDDEFSPFSKQIGSSYSEIRTKECPVKVNQVLFCIPTEVERITGTWCDDDGDTGEHSDCCIIVNYRLISSKSLILELLEKLDESPKSMYGLDDLHIYTETESCIIYPKFFFRKYGSGKELEKLYCKIGLMCNKVNFIMVHSSSGSKIGSFNFDMMQIQQPQMQPNQALQFAVMIKNEIKKALLKKFTFRDLTRAALRSSKVIYYILRLALGGVGLPGLWINLVKTIIGYLPLLIRWYLYEYERGAIQTKILVKLSTAPFKPVIRIAKRVARNESLTQKLGLSFKSVTKLIETLELIEFFVTLVRTGQILDYLRGEKVTKGKKWKRGYLKLLFEKNKGK